MGTERLSRSVGAVLMVALLCAACTTALSSPSATPSATPSSSPSSSPAPQPSAAITCVPWAVSLPSDVAAADPCPSVITAVEAVVAPLGLPIARLYVEPGLFPCGELWPGLPSTNPICPDVMLPPGTAMHGWVSFAGSDKVAAVQLFRQPSLITTENPMPSPWPWQATLRAFAVPPAGWVMPGP